MYVICYVNDVVGVISYVICMQYRLPAFVNYCDGYKKIHVDPVTLVCLSMYFCTPYVSALIM